MSDERKGAERNSLAAAATEIERRLQAAQQRTTQAIAERDDLTRRLDEARAHVEACHQVEGAFREAFALTVPKKQAKAAKPTPAAQEGA